MLQEYKENHPGWILYENYIKPLNITQRELANKIKYPLEEINEVIAGRMPITAKLAVRLTKVFPKTARFWLDMQVTYDIEQEFKLWKEENGQEE